MNIGEIAERLVQAAEIDRNSGGIGGVGPAPARSLALPYTHDWADMNGWGKERLDQERVDFALSLSRRPTAQQISEAEEAWSWLALVDSEDNRAALAGWARCMSGSGFFKDWCFKRSIHPITGTRRKDRALCEISAKLVRRMVQHCETGADGVLLDTPEIEDIPDILKTDAPAGKSIRAWSDDDAFRPFLTNEPGDFSWAAKRNERRRQQEARKRREQQKAA